MVFDPMRFLLLLEQKIGALDQAPPRQGWELPGEFAALPRLLESKPDLATDRRSRTGLRPVGLVARQLFGEPSRQGAARKQIKWPAIAPAAGPFCSGIDKPPVRFLARACPPPLARSSGEFCSGAVFHLTCRHVHDELGKLVGVSGSLGSVCHACKIGPILAPSKLSLTRGITF